MTAGNLSGYVAEKRAHGIPWNHIANMAGCCADDLGAYRVAEARGLLVAPPAPTPAVPAPVVKAAPLSVAQAEPAPRRRRRGPGGLLLAVLFAVGDGYSTSLTISALIETSIDNVNGALRRLEASDHVEPVSEWNVSPVVWAATEGGMAHLRCQMAEGFD